METLIHTPIAEYIDIIRDRVNILPVKGTKYFSTSNNTYTYYKSIDSEKLITFVFKDIETNELKMVRVRKSTKSVCYDGFTDTKYIITKEETAEMKRLYLKEYYKKSLKAKRLQKRAEMKKNLEDKVCLVCGKTFKPKHGKQVTCSEECKVTRQKQRTEEYVKSHRDHLNQLAREYRLKNPNKFKQYSKKYHATEKGKEAFKRYITSEKGKATVKRGIERRKQLNNSSQTEE